MSYIKVKILTPNGQGFTASIDAEATVESVLKELVEHLHLPPRRYELHLVNALRIQDGATIRISEPLPVEAIRLVE